MTEQELINLLLASFPDAEVSVSLDGSHVEITVVTPEFEGLRPVARQQRVYAPLAALIADGTLHAVNITAQTP
ncbi:MAG: BolA family transcriptional regulator [Halieaceae bacterium]|nr:BolA family transcriptional regulator [Halieaceae bacterium]